MTDCPQGSSLVLPLLPGEAHCSKDQPLSLGVAPFPQGFNLNPVCPLLPGVAHYIQDKLPSLGVVHDPKVPLPSFSVCPQEELESCRAATWRTLLPSKVHSYTNPHTHQLTQACNQLRGLLTMPSPTPSPCWTKGIKWGKWVQPLQNASDAVDATLQPSGDTEHLALIPGHSLPIPPTPPWPTSKGLRVWTNRPTMLCYACMLKEIEIQKEIVVSFGLQRELQSSLFTSIFKEVSKDYQIFMHQP